MGKFSENLSKRVSIRGPKEGVCVICGSYGKLTRDHVPPKSCHNVADRELKVLLPQSGVSYSPQASQGGTHFRTVCNHCNSNLLGTETDPELKKFVDEVSTRVKSAYSNRVAMPRFSHVKLKPQRVARSVVGHILAANAVSEAQKGLQSSPIFDAMRDYFLDFDACLPKDLNVYWWLYPCNRQVIIKGIGKSAGGSRDVIVGNILKFFPFGFWVTYNEPFGFSDDLNSLVCERDIGIDDSRTIRIDYSDIPPLGFPEKPVGNEVVLMNDEAAVTADEKP